VESLTSAALNLLAQTCWLFLDILITAVLLRRISTFRKDSQFQSTVAMLGRLIILVRYDSLCASLTYPRQSFATCLVVLMAQAVSLILFYRLDFSTACPTEQAVCRLQILTVLAHLSSRARNRTALEGSRNGVPSFVSFGTSSGGSCEVQKVRLASLAVLHGLTVMARCLPSTSSQRSTQCYLLPSKPLWVF
jgi:hypothetical protein